ncbi:serine/threonine protein phosphatase [Aureimonas flava]|uniref:serine/threonine protein phosphatase n=1 Tax=Aureimonas flava TaxID=2320271 RepID=UPI0010A963FD|nr:serine/threonine protein phosphatase [Aureimonas flava]
MFIKDFGKEGVSFGCRVHARLSAILPAGIWSASPPADPRQRVARELRKSARFRAAGIAVPDLAPAGPTALSASDAGSDTQAVLKRLRLEGETARHDALLVALAGSLAEIHAAGLCHGRPHPRDTAPLGGGRFVWFDFEEEPEAAMPLSDAQARDLWLLFFQVCHRAIDPQTPLRAMAAYRARAPETASTRLRLHLCRLAWTLGPGRLLLRLHNGGDLLRYVAATTFLLAALTGVDPMPGPLAPRPAATWSEEDGGPSL